MEKTKQSLAARMRENILTIGWAVKMAIKINAGIFLFWGILSTTLAILPAVALHFNRYAVAVLSDFLATGEGSFSDIMPSIIALGIILTVVGISKRITQHFLYSIMFNAFHYGMQEHMMDTVRRIEIKTLMDKKYYEDFYASTYRVGALTDLVSSGTLFLSKLVGAIALLAVAASVSVAIFIATAVYLVALIFLNIIAADKLRWNNLEQNEATRLAQYYQTSAMNAGVAKEMRVYGLQKETMTKFAQAFKRVEKYDGKRVFYRQIVAFISGIGFYIFMVGLLGYSVFQVAGGWLSVDVFLMLYVMSQNISDVAQVLSRSFQEADRGVYFLSIQRRFLKNTPRTSEDWQEGFEPADTENAFTASNLSFSYDDQREVLQDLTFSIKKGETIALVGVNGSGKTTLVKLLIGLFAPTKGDLRFYGKPYEPKTRGAIIKRVGMFFQDFYIFHATLRENVGFGDLKNLANDNRIQLAMEKGGADKLPSRFAAGLEQWLMRHIKKDGALLSGGEKQRVAVSRAHMSDKEILIFDEPAAALDPIAEMKQFEAIREKLQGRTAILISHRVGFARLADKIIVLDKGRLVETGTHNQLMESGGIYANFFNEQASWYQQEVATNE
ncbi:MAG: ABC transporter ATP-binding protein/permease [Defluviitaleaceae bacterium]|nr:ABC transporter ATP-binding protein/permease [Defluviitaleaceae bacterium]